MSWNRSLREKAAELFEKGLGYKAVSSELGINCETVRDWSYTWRALGTKGFLSSYEGKRAVYTAEVKMAVVQDRLAGMSVVEVMSKHHISNRHRVKEWVGMYIKNGEKAFGLAHNKR